MTEHDRARHWRVNVMRLSRVALARRTGYSVGSIQIFERGMGYSGRPIGAAAWLKYRMACAAVHVGVREFNWDKTRTQERSREPEKLYSRQTGTAGMGP